MSIGSLLNKAPKTVLGVDASTKSFAFFLCDAAGPRSWGEVVFDGGTVFERLSDGQKKVTAMANLLQADLVVIESAVFINNKKTVIQLAYAYGAIISALMVDGVKVIEVSPLAWQHFIGNPPLTKPEKQGIIDTYPGKSKTWYTAKNREVRKERTIQWAKDTFGITIESDNVGDAIAISFYGKNGDFNA